MMSRGHRFKRGALFGLFLASVPWQFSSEAIGAEKVTFFFDWIANGRHSSFYVSLDKGFYAKQGLDVAIHRGFGSGDTIKKVLGGQAQFGISEIPAVITARAQEMKVRTLGLIYGKGIVAIYTLKGAGISEPRQLSQKTTADSPYGYANSLFPPFAQLHNIQGWKIINVNPAAKVPTFLTGKADFMVGTITQYPYVKSAAAKAGKDIHVMLFSDHGLDLYSIALVASEKLTLSNTDVARGFVRATMEGLAWTLEHPAEGVKIFLKHNPEAKPKEAHAQWDITVNHIVTEDFKKHGLGWVDREKMAFTIDIISKHSKVSRKVAPEEIYTNEFLPGIFPPGVK